MALISPRRRARARWLILTLAVTILGLSLGVGAFAAPRTQSNTLTGTIEPLAGSTFEGGDGNVDVTTGGLGHTDWGIAAGWPLPSATSGDRSYTYGDDRTGGTDDAMGQGTKEDSTAVTIVAGSIPPNKNDLTTFSVATERTSGSSFLYLSWRRATNIGNANMDFEINQAASTSLTDGSGGVTVVRTNGDHLITYDFATTTKPSIGLYTWSDGTWGARKELTAYTQAMVDPSTGLFGEVAIDLTRSGFFGDAACTTFGWAWVKSRSSTSFTAEVKDFIRPIAVNINNCFPQISTRLVPNLTVHLTDLTSGTTGGGTDFPNGTLTVQLWDTSSCTGIKKFEDTSTATSGRTDFLFTTDNTGGTDAEPTAFSATTGTFYWKVTYTGDARNPNVETSCGFQTVTAGP